jgi:hypothetical protein
MTQPAPPTTQTLPRGHCPACRQMMPLIGEFPNTVWVSREVPFELLYDCPHCGVRLRETRGARLSLEPGLQQRRAPCTP